MRLIDADELKTILSIRRTIETIQHAVDNAPTVDAVPVVWCKDCKCWTEWANNTGSCSRFALDWIGTDADDFCSMAERRDDETDRR